MFKFLGIKTELSYCENQKNRLDNKREKEKK